MSQNNAAKSERRHYARLQYQEPITVQKVVESKSGNVFEVQGETLVVKAQNVSEGGIKLGTSLPDALGKILKLNIKVREDETLDVFTKVAWSGNGCSGLEFVAMDNQIRKWVKGFTRQK